MPLADHAAARRQQLEPLEAEALRWLKPHMSKPIEAVVRQLADAAFTAGAIAGRDRILKLPRFNIEEVFDDNNRFQYTVLEEHEEGGELVKVADLLVALRAIAPPDRET